MEFWIGTGILFFALLIVFIAFIKYYADEKERKEK